jgi:hypothetical protein
MHITTSTVIKSCISRYACSLRLLKRCLDWLLVITNTLYISDLLKIRTQERYSLRSSSGILLEFPRWTENAKTIWRMEIDQC